MDLVIDDDDVFNNASPGETTLQTNQSFDGFEQITHMDTGHGATGALQFPVLFAGERDHGPMATLADTCGDEADDPRMPVRLVERDARRQIAARHRIDGGECGVAHPGLDLPSFAIDAVERRGEASSCSSEVVVEGGGAQLVLALEGLVDAADRESGRIA